MFLNFHCTLESPGEIGKCASLPIPLESLGQGPKHQVVSSKKYSQVSSFYNMGVTWVNGETI